MPGSIFEREEGTRWPRSQKFQLTALGTEAEQGYQAAIRESQERGGRAAFEEATAAWAKGLGVQPNDGVFLVELKSGPKGFNALLEGLEGTGAIKSELRSAMDRLIAAKLAEPVAR